MARKKAAIRGKSRTREHIIADLAVNHLERHVLLCGYTLESFRHDYGYDLIMSTFNEEGEAEPGVVFFQVKATDYLPLLKDERTISWPISRRDLKLWLQDIYPVILVVYDAGRNRAFWLHVQAVLRDIPPPELFAAGDRVNVHISVQKRVNQRAIRQIARTKNDLQHLLQTKGRHDV